MRFFVFLFVSFFCYISSSYAVLMKSDVQEITDLEYEVLQTKDTKRIFDFYNIILGSGLRLRIRDIHILPDTYNRTDSLSFDKKGFIEYQVDLFKEYSIKKHELRIKRVDNIEASKRAVVEYELWIELYKRMSEEEGEYLQERKIKATCRDIYIVDGLAAQLDRRDCTHRNDYITSNLSE